MSRPHTPPHRLAQALRLCFLLLLVVTPLLPLTRAQAQEPPDALALEVESLLAAMSPEERVGQLFLVTFPSNQAGEGSIAARLVQELHVGGVALRASNGNYVNDEAAPTTLAALTSAVQGLALAASQVEGSGPFVPLFITMDLYSPSATFADGMPQAGFSSIPSEMALGATWDPTNAALVGRVVGQELSAIGVNLLLGPVLDVVDSPRPEEQTNVGTRTFGGDPYWVGQMGRSFVQGVAQGSGGRVGTVARNFPGLGSSDRSPDQEIATVQKPLQALQLEDLPPFFAVTDLSSVVSGTVDGLMTTNLRYRGLQGNIRQSSNPISLDPQSLPTLLGQPELQPWRTAGGILVSDELGARALRIFYGQQSPDNPFPVRTIAQAAHNAGNDLLFLADFALEDDWEARYSNIQQVARFFAEQYRSDPGFASRVDQSLRRLLRLKLRLYGGSFESGATALPDPLTLAPSPLRAIELGNELDRIAREAATLLDPGPSEVADRLPRPPLGDETIVLFTDGRTLRDCATCPARPVIPVDALESVLLRRYGPNGTEQLNPARISSYSFEALRDFLNAPPTVEEAQSDPLATDLRNADWLLFLTQDVSPEVPASDALRLFLDSSSGQVREQKLLVFSFGAPYYLDATEASKVTAYFAFYTPSPRAIEAAALLLFQGYSATGSPPVSIAALNYELARRLEPNASQVVELCMDGTEDPAAGCQPLTVEDVQFGGELALRTGVIRDHNDHPVPDGTIVTFILRYPNENVEGPRQSVQTVDGIAHARIPLEREGQLAITASSEPPSFSSTTVLVTIQGGDPPQVQTVVPTSPPTFTATPSATPTATPRPTRTASATPVPPTATPTPLGNGWGQSNVGFGWWIFWGALGGLAMVSGVGLATAPPSRVVRVRRLLHVALFGLAGYVLYLLAFGFGLLPDDFNGWGAIFLAVLGGLLGLIHQSTSEEWR